MIVATLASSGLPVVVSIVVLTLVVWRAGQWWLDTRDDADPREGPR